MYTHLINKKLPLPQHIPISKYFGIVIVFAAKHNGAISSTPSLRYLDASSRIPTEAVWFLKAGLLDQVAKGVLAVREISGVEQLVRSRDETFIGLCSIAGKR